MYKFINYIQNYVKIKIKGSQPQKFINICMKRHIAVWELERISDREFSLCMFSGDFKKNARSIARKAHVHVTITEKKGILYSVKHILVRKSFIAAAVLTAALFCLLSSMVWRIDVGGADAASRIQARRLLDELGIKKGMLSSNINARSLSQELLNRQSGLSWVGVKKHGMTLSIELEKGTFYTEMTSDNILESEPCDIAVSKDCLLYKITVENGEKRISEGNTALAGDIVVSGAGKHARAEIMGIVWYRAETEIKQDVQQTLYTGRVKKTHSLILFGLKIDSPSWKWLPWNWGNDNFKLYDSFYDEKCIENGKIPIGYASLTMREARTETVHLTDEAAKLKAKTDAQAALDAAIPDDATVLSTSGGVVERDGVLYYAVEAGVLENVGIYVSPAPEAENRTPAPAG